MKKSDIYKGFLELIDGGKISITCVRSDQGSEYLAKSFHQICIGNYIRQEFSSVATPQEKGISERFNRTILDKTRIMLSESNLPTNSWSFALIQAIFLYNLCPHSSLNNATPVYRRFGL